MTALRILLAADKPAMKTLSWSEPFNFRLMEFALGWADHLERSSSERGKLLRRRKSGDFSHDPTAHAEVLGDSQSMRGFAQLRIERLRAVHFLRTVPHVPRRDLLGAPLAPVFRQHAEDAAKIGFDDSFIYGELKQPFSERRIPTAQSCAKKRWPVSRVV